MAGGGGGGWWAVAHEQQQRAFAADSFLRQRRVNTIQPLLRTLPMSLVHQGSGPGRPPTDWDGGGIIRQIGSIPTRSRMDRNLLVDDHQVRLRQQQQSVVNLPRGGEFPRGGISREVFTGNLRLRDSRDGILSNDLISSAIRSPISLLDDAARVEMPRAYQQRPAAAAQQQQQEQLLDPLIRNRKFRIGVEENGHAELIARYGDRSSARNLEIAHDAIGRGYQLENFSRKRTREEDANLDRDRLIRQRKLSGNVSASPLPLWSPQSGFGQLKESNQEIQHKKAAKFWQLQAEENEDVQEKQRNSEIEQRKAKYWQHTPTEEGEHKAIVLKHKDRNQEFQQRKAAKYWQQLQKDEDELKLKGQQKERNQEFQKHKAAKYWQQLQSPEDRHDGRVQQKERNQEFQQQKGNCWKLQTEEDEHEEGQVTQETQEQCGNESKTHLLKQEPNLMAISSRTEVTPKVEGKTTGPRNHSNSAYPSGALEFRSNSRSQSRSSRSPKAMENGIPESDELKPLGRSRDQSLLALERHPQSPRYTNNERTLSRFELVSTGCEPNSLMPSDFSDMRTGRKGIRESQNRTSGLNSKSAGKLDHDGQHQKHQRQLQNTLRRERDLRSLHSSREFRDSSSGGRELESFLAESARKHLSGRTETNLKRKVTSKTTATANDARPLGEMTISLHKHGQRIVKVEEYKPRDTAQSRVGSLTTNKDHRLLTPHGGTFRCGSEETFPVSSGRDRFSMAKRKDYEGRSPRGNLEKTPRSDSSRRLQYLEKTTSQDRFPPYAQLVKDELTARTGKYEPEPTRHQSIFSRLVGLRPKTNPTRTPAETKRKKKSFLAVHDKASLPSSSRKSSSVLVETSARVDVDGSPHQFPGFQISSRSRSADFSGEFEDSALKNLNRKDFVAEPVPCTQTGPCERPNDNLQKVQALDVSPQYESATKPQLEPGVSTLSYDQELFSPSEQGLEGLQKDHQRDESPKLKNPDHSKSYQEGNALQLGDSGCSALLLSSETGAPEESDPVLEDGLTVHPKVIATGHRKDQILKNSLLDAEQVVQTLPIEAVIPVENINQEKGERSLSILSEEGLPGLESPSPTLKAERLGSTSPLPDCDRASPQSDLTGKQPIVEDEPSAVVAKTIRSEGTRSPPTGSGSRQELDPSKSSLDAIDFENPNLPPAMETLSCLQSSEGVPQTEVLELHSDGDTASGLSVGPLSSSSLSTPKEVRLFGANLNAHMGEEIDLVSTALGSMDHAVVESSNLPTEDQDQDPVSVERYSNGTAVIQVLEKDVFPPVRQAGDESLSVLDKHNKAEQAVQISNDAVKDLKSAAHDPPLLQVQFEELPSIPQEQHALLPQLQRTTAAAHTQGGHLSSSHASGAHTWRRGTSFSSTPVNNANVFRSTSAFGGVIQSAGRSQITAYVRKGNSLVRAPGAANLPSTYDTKAVSVMPGQAKPFAKKLPMKPTPSRNTFPPTTSKPYFSTSRRYIAPLIESDAAPGSFVRSVNPPKIPNSNHDLGKSQSLQSAMTKTSPAVQQACPQAITVLIPHQEQQMGVTSSPELSVLDSFDDRSCGDSVCRYVEKTSSSHSTDLIAVPGNLGSRVLETPVSTNRLYVRRKANQLVVAPSQNSNLLSVDAEGTQAKTTGYMLGQYFKRKTNQLVRRNSGKGSLARTVARNSLRSGVSSSIPDERGGGSNLILKKMRRGRGMRLKKVAPGRSSRVWRLNGADVGHPNNSSAENRRTGPLVFPWKRQNSLRTPVRSQKLRPLPEVEKGSFLFLMSKRLRKVRPVQPVYTRSADGFSLRRSGVMSVGGGNLKWTKSLEKRAKQASEEVTKAVAEAERRKREEKEALVEAAAKAKDERRAVRKAARGEGERIVWVGLVRYKMDAASKTLERVQDLRESGNTDESSSTGWAMTSPLLTPRRSIIGGTVYLRVGNGNQLVRDPKTASRALASEKVRWSLHNARSRRAKKQQYCQFFTKFGKCNKESGKCPYIHDPEKVAVCTKFLKGNCTDVQCLLTHKVIPERMPDCSFFLEGLCTNETCPYRHVNVNPKASHCDGFLRGYCKNGDQCNKKHTYVCSVYAETGECSDRSTCKFHHPKKKVKLDLPVISHKIGVKSKRRYFSSIEPQPIRPAVDVKSHDQISTVFENGLTSNEGSMEFISLSNIESDEEQTVMSPSEPWPEPGVTFTMQEAASAEREKWIKPTFLLQSTSSTAVAH